MASSGFNLAFAGPVRKARRIDIHENQDAVEREEVVGLTDQGLTTAGPGRAREGPKVIPALPNTYRGPGRGYVPSFVPESVDGVGEVANADKFEAAAQDTAEAQVSMTYGLNTRERPVQETGKTPRSVHEDTEAQALRKDLQELPEVASLEAYEAMPVEAFGEAMLRHAEAWVAEGSHAGLACLFLAHEPKREGRSARARVCLLPSNEAVVVRLSELSLTKPAPENGKHRRDREPTDRSSRHSAEPTGEHRREPADSRSWLMPNIRVKIVDKRVEKGRVYLKKGTIVDVTSPQTCDVYVDDARVTVQDLRQGQLETVVPSLAGTPLLILAGRHRSRHAVLLRRSTEAGVAAVRLVGDLESNVLRLSLDDVAEYTGDDHGDDGH